MRVSAAPCRKVGAVHADRLDETDSREGLAFSQPEGLVTEPLLYCLEAFDAYAFLHLTEVSFSRHFTVVPTGRPHLLVSSESLDQVFDVGYLLQLTEQEGSQVTFRLVLYRPPCSFKAQAFPDDGVKR